MKNIFKVGIAALAMASLAVPTMTIGAGVASADNAPATEQECRAEVEQWRFRTELHGEKEIKEIQWPGNSSDRNKIAQWLNVPAGLSGEWIALPDAITNSVWGPGGIPDNVLGTGRVSLTVYGGPNLQVNYSAHAIQTNEGWTDWTEWSTTNPGQQDEVQHRTGPYGDVIPCPVPNQLFLSHTEPVCAENGGVSLTITLRNVSPWIYPTSVEIDGVHSYGPTVDNRTNGGLNGPQKDQSATRTITFAEDSGSHTVRYRIQAGSENQLYIGKPVGEWTNINVDTTDCITPEMITPEVTYTPPTCSSPGTAAPVEREGVRWEPNEDGSFTAYITDSLHYEWSDPTMARGWNFPAPAPQLSPADESCAPTDPPADTVVEGEYTPVCGVDEYTVIDTVSHYEWQWDGNLGEWKPVKVNEERVERIVSDPQPDCPTHDLYVVCTSINEATGQGSVYIENRSNQSVTVEGTSIAAGESDTIEATGDEITLSYEFADGTTGVIDVEGGCGFIPPVTEPPTTSTPTTMTVPSTDPGPTTTASPVVTTQPPAGPTNPPAGPTNPPAPPAPPAFEGELPATGAGTVILVILALAAIGAGVIVMFVARKGRDVIDDL